MNRVCLIVPPSPFLADERVFVSLGILKVAACLEQAGYPVDVLDLSGVENYEDAVTNYIVNRSGIEPFGITVTTPQCPAAEKITNRIREAADGRITRIIWGGPHVTVVNAARKLEVKKGIIGRAHKAFARIANVADVLVAGDGEEAIFVAIQPHAPKLIDADDPDGQLFLDKHRLSEMPLPARHLIDLDSYHYYIAGQRASSLIMQLGCPFSCRFCSGRLSPSFRRVRIRDIDNVLREIEQIYRSYGYCGLMMYDDELNVNPNMIQDMYAITRLRDKLGIDFRLRGFIKADLFNENQALTMKEAGFREICVGFESGSTRILKNIKKQATVDQNTKCMEIAKKYSLRVKGFTSLAHPGETEETAKQTHDWLVSVEVDDFDVTVISPFPGTPYHDNAKLDDGVWVYAVPENGDKLYMEDIDYVKEAHYYKGQIGNYRSHVWTEAIDKENIVRLRNWIETSVRQKLRLPFYHTVAAQLYDHSCGQLPPSILRRIP